MNTALRAQAAIATLAIATLSASVQQTVNSAFLNGEEVAIHFELADSTRKSANYTLGPWRFGAKIKDVRKGTPEKPQDLRLNAYIVVPGTAHANPDDTGFNHNLVINALPPEGKSSEYDVYFVLVLDPSLQADIRSEREILRATQARFTPNDLFELEDAPSVAVLKNILKIESTPDLQRFRKKGRKKTIDDGTLPRMVIVPAGFALRASAPPSVILPASP